MVRANMKRLIILDEGVVETDDMADHFYSNEDVGKPKAQMTAERLMKMVGGVIQVQGIDMSLAQPSDADTLTELIRTEVADLVICCGSAEQSNICNQACLTCKQVWIEGRVEDNAYSWHYQKMTPGVGACLECLPLEKAPAAGNPNLKQLEEHARAANCHSLAWMVLEETFKHFVGGALPYFCNTFSVEGNATRDMR